MMSDSVKRVAAMTVGALLLLAIGFASGRFGTAERVKIEERVEYVDRIVYEDRVVEKIVYVKAEKVRTNKTTTSTKKPDGTETTTIVENTGIDTSTSNTSTKEEETKVERETDLKTEKTVEVTKPMPDWRIAVLGGVNGPQLPGLLGGQPFDPLKHLSIGVHAEHRIVGPISAGVFGLSSGQVGISVGLEF